MKSSRCKGARDLPPEDMARFRYIEDVFRTTCTRWGYREIRTPTIEYLHLFTSTGTLTPGMLGRLYTFLDWDGWSGERVVLRPDATIPAARLYLDCLGQQALARLFYVTSVFAFEESGEENRERWQLGAELIGDDTPQADMELVELATGILKGLGVQGFEISLSHAGLLKSLLREFDISPAQQAEVFDRILDGNGKVLSTLKPRSQEAERAINLLLGGTLPSGNSLKNLVATLEGSSSPFKKEMDDFLRVIALMDLLGQPYHIDLLSGRGFEYYTGVIFQVFKGKERLAGGGRYNDLIPLMGGGDVPACGFALYLDPLMEMVSPASPERAGGEKGIIVRPEEGPSQAESVKGCFEAARLLRQAGFVAELDFNHKAAGARWSLYVQGRGEECRLSLKDSNLRKVLEPRSVREVTDFLGKNHDL